MSTYKFRVIFSGLCGFVPRGNKGEESDPKRVDVLLAKTSDGAPDASSFSEYQELSPHVAMVQFVAGNLVGVDDTVTAKGIWRLTGEDVNFRLISVNGVDGRDLNRGVSMKLDGRREGHRSPFEDTKNITDPGARGRDLKNQTADFSWLPEMEKVIGGKNAAVNPACFSDNPSGFVVARFRLEEGVLISKDLGVYRGSPIVAQFVPAFENDSEYSQALAHRVALEADIDDSFNVVFEAKNFKGDTTCSIVLKPGNIVNQEGVVERGIELEVSNLCCGNALLEGDSRPEETSTPAPSIDHDFSYMYELLNLYQDLQKEFVLPLPVPIIYEKSKLLSSSSGGIHGVECTGCRFPFLPLGG
jgi:hypothetical protein